MKDMGPERLKATTQVVEGAAFDEVDFHLLVDNRSFERLANSGAFASDVDWGEACGLRTHHQEPHSVYELLGSGLIVDRQ